MQNLFERKWGSIVERERRRRIFLSVWAYAYEFESQSIVTDEVYDNESKLVNLSLKTGNDKIDQFFETQFNPNTGLWIHHHPELWKVRRMYERHYMPTRRRNS